MFYCRLLDEQGHVLAEETFAAPDHVCIVLDPNMPGPDGKPQAAQLSPDGPVTFQVRMPKVESAAMVKLYRLEGPPPAARDAEPAGKLIAAIPLPH